GNIIVADYENRMSVDIQNAGLGPLIIKKFVALDKNDNELNSLIEAFKDSKIKEWTSFIEQIKDRIIPPSKKLNLIEMHYDVNNNTDIENREIIRNVLKEITIKVYYTDVYGEKENFVQRKLDFFGRHFRIDALSKT
ncbi:hypothetical protein A2V82_02035, partial [candidate division KSB1 bacterium RBG_16_48_16]